MLYKASGFFSTTLHLFSVFHEIKKHQLLDFYLTVQLDFVKLLMLLLKDIKFLD